MADDNIVYIGTKPINSYVMAAVTQFNAGNCDVIVLKARGRAISRAVDVAEVLTKRFMKDQVRIKDVSTDTEVIKNRDGKPTNVSSIEIVLERIS